MHSEDSCPGHAAASADSAQRRRVIRIAAAGVAIGLTGIAAVPAHARPAAGDRLVLDDAEGADPVAIRVDDVKPGKPLLAFPFDPKIKQVRNDSRLNKVVLVRIAESDLDAESKARAAGGVLAFSAICTHQACEVKTWLANDKALVCFCHSSKFLPQEGGKVGDGPAPRGLPTLPLSAQDGQLVVAGTFSTRPGPS